ncbi:MAG: permease [Candidatus Atribacteria bacterium]|nr:permease [Candidatus Atribacteria bacterium]
MKNSKNTKKVSWKSFNGLNVLIIFSVVVFLFFPREGARVYRVVGQNILFMLEIIPPIFLLLGLFDVWVSREKVTQHLGDRSGLKGTGISIALGALAAGPLYAAFPIAEVMLRKGTSLRNIFLFIGAWSTMKIPMLLFELQSLGARFALTRYAMSFLGIFCIAFFLDKLLLSEDKQNIIKRLKE